MCGRGYAKHIALPLLRSFYTTKGNDHTRITKEEATSVIRKCMEVLYYRVPTPFLMPSIPFTFLETVDLRA